MSDSVSIPIADCSLCRFRSKTLLAGRCMPGDTCVLAESGRQIDRFFRVNPEYAQIFLLDKFWERRAIAVRYSPLSALSVVMDDEDEVVRRAVVYRLPAHQLKQFIYDPDREVRMTVADRINNENLELLADDNDYIVRLTVARRLHPGRLFRYIKDPDLQVRKAVAERLPEVSLGLMKQDSDAEIRRIIASRINDEEAIEFLQDEDWLVRYIAAERVPIEALSQLLSDTEPDVREMAAHRLKNTKQEQNDD